MRRTAGQARKWSSGATVRVFAPHQLAEKERMRLFEGLQRFANLGDTPDAFQRFGKSWPSFFPVRVGDFSAKSKIPLDVPCFEIEVVEEPEPSKIIARAVTPRSNIWAKDISWQPVCHDLALAYRDALQYLWTAQTDPKAKESLQVLLGIHRPDGPIMPDIYVPLSEGWDRVEEVYSGACMEDRPIIYPRWKRGDFAYDPRNDFQRAVYLLFRESWRAKICALCGGYFIAQKAGQLYCSTKCTGEAKRRRDLEWWRVEGSQRRKRKAKARGKKGGK